MHQKICLLIDDDKEDRDFFSSALRQISPGTKLITADDAESAKKILREENAPDLIFLDLSLPGMDGTELLLELKRDIRHRKIPVIVYSQMNDQEQISKTKKFGAADYVLKTSVVDDLYKMLQKYLA